MPKAHKVYCKPLNGATGNPHSRYFYLESDAKSLVEELDGNCWDMTFQGEVEVRENDPEITLE